MKKIFVFLSVCLLALTGCLFACNEDRYANLEISVGEVKSMSGNNIEYIAEGDYYEVEYNDSFYIQGLVKGPGDMAKSLVFDSYSNDAIHKISTQQTDVGSTAVFNANKPSDNKDNKFYTIKIYSYETPRKAIYVNVKVVLPVQKIELAKNMALTYGKDNATSGINLYDNITYTSTHPESGYLTTQKKVYFNILSFTDSKTNRTYSTNPVDDQLELVENINSISGVKEYGIKIDGTNDVLNIFSLLDDKINVLDSSYKGILKVEAKSKEYDENFYNVNLEDYLTIKAIGVDKRTPEQTELLNKFDENEKLKSVVDISVIRGINYSDISLNNGGQIGFAPSKTALDKDVAKLSAQLYTNTLADYLDEYSYLSEQIWYSVIADTTVNVEVIEVESERAKLLDAEGNAILDNAGNEIYINRVAKNTNGSAKTASSCVVSYTKIGNSIKFSAIQETGSVKTGESYFDLVFVYSDFSNKPSFKLSDLYLQFLRDLYSDEESDKTGVYCNQILGEDGKTIMGLEYDSVLYFNVSALPNGVNVFENGNLINFEYGTMPLINVYDDYATNFNYGYGTKFSLDLMLADGMGEAKIDDSNKKVKVLIYNEDATINPDEFLEIKNFAGNSITTRKDDGSNYFVIDLSKSPNYFYVKSKKNVAYTTFTISIINELTTTIKTFDGNIIEPNTASTSLKNNVQNLKIETVKGVNDIQIFTKVFNESGEGSFYEVGYNSAEGETNKAVVLKLYPNSPTYINGTVLGIFVNKNTKDNLTISIGDSNIAKVFDNLEGDYSDIFDGNGEAKEGNNLLRLISVAGTKLGTTTLTFVASNGYETKVNVKVVEEILNNFDLTLNKDLSKYAVTESELGKTALNNSDFKTVASVRLNSLSAIDSINSKTKISAKVENSFKINYGYGLKTTSLNEIGTKILVLDKTGADVTTNVIDLRNETGAIIFTTKKVGEYFVFVEFDYSYFANLNKVLYGNKFVTWGGKTEVRAFKLTIFEPATSVDLNKYAVIVYDYNSLGYEYKEESHIDISVVVKPEKATIKSLDDSIKFDDDNESIKKYLVGSNGHYIAKLPSNETSVTIYLWVDVFEFGLTHHLPCKIVIKKATQINEIGVAIFDGDQEKENQPYAKDRETIYVATKNGRTLTVNTTINPGPNVVFIDDLMVRMFRAGNDDNHSINMSVVSEFDEGKAPATLRYRGEEAGYLTLNDGQDAFDIVINSSISGYFYIVIFAKDSMTSDKAGSVYVKILIQITDGTLKDPYVVSNIDELMDISNDPTKHYVLGADINLSSYANWNPIAVDGFTGSLNGYNHNIAGNETGSGKFFTISGLKISQVTGKNLGLFAKLTTRKEVVEEEVEGELVESTYYHYGAILNLKLIVERIDLVEKFADEELNIGGLVGINEGGLIMDCSVKVKDLSVNILNQNVNVGGVVGKLDEYRDFDGVVQNFAAIINLPNESDIIGDVYAGLASEKYILTYSDLDTNYSYSKTTIGKYVNKICKEESINGSFISSNPFEVVIDVSDAEGNSSNVGGLVGLLNGGNINGIYGTYDYIDKLNTAGTAYLTSYQSEGFDVNVKINCNKEKTYNISENSCFGGVVGKTSGGYILNISSVGQIGYFDGTVNGAKNNIGGLAGYIEGSEVFNTLSAVKLRANTNVGGAVGTLVGGSLKQVRVENYEEKGLETNQDISLIIVVGENSCAGGVVGYINNESDSTTIELAYSDSFINKFNEAYMMYGDIYSPSNNVVLGGVVGFVKQGLLNLGRSFSAFNVIANDLLEATRVGGIVGGYNETGVTIEVSNVYYIGVLNGRTINPICEEQTTNPDISEAKISGYYYYCQLEYVDLDDNTEDEVHDYKLKNVKFGSVATGDYITDDNRAFWSESDLYEFEYCYEEDGEIKIGTSKTKVLMYGYPSDTDTDAERFNFIKFVPDSISISTKTGVVDAFDKTSFSVEKWSNRFASFEKDGKLYVVAKLSTSGNNTFKLNDIFNIIPDPKVSGRLNIVVYFDNSENLITINNEGKLILKALTGKNPIKLEFYVRENIYASEEVYLYIVENFDELLVSSDISFEENLFDKTGTNPFEIRKNTYTTIFNVLTEKVNLKDALDRVVLKNIGKESLVNILNKTGYTIDFKVIDVTSGEPGTEAIERTDYERDGLKIKFYNADKLYKVVVSIKFRVADQELTISNENWEFYYKVYEGATNVSFNASEIWMESNETYDKLIFNLESDVLNFDTDGLTIIAPSFNLYLEDKTNVADSETGVKYDLTTKEGDEDFYYIGKLKIFKDFKVTYNVGTYYYNFNIKVDEDEKLSIKEPITYILYAYDEDDVFKSSPAQVKIVIAPQSLKGVSASHYRYTQDVSKLVNSANTEASLENTTYAYSFTSEPKNTVVAGSEGLFAIDLYPYYSKISSVSIESSLSSSSGNALQFVQLVRVRDNATGGYKYIYAPTAKTRVEGGIYLGLYSDAVDNSGKIVTLDFATNGGLSDIVGYVFPQQDKEELKTSEMGRLFVKTVAPTNLREEESFIITIRVKYWAFNESFEYVEQEFVYYHTLIVESVSDYSIDITHEGVERNVIAVSDEDNKDWLDIKLNFDETYTSGRLIASYLTAIDRKNPDKDLSNSSYVELLNGDKDYTYKLVLGKDAKVGGRIKLNIVLEVNYEGYVETRSFVKYIDIVDLVIKSVSLQGAYNDVLSVTVSTSKQLKALIDGYGKKEVIEQAQNTISRLVSLNYNTAYYWFAKPGNAYVPIDDISVKNLPYFNINKVMVSNDQVSLNINGEKVSEVIQKVIVLEGSTMSSINPVEMLLKFSYIYFDGDRFVNDDETNPADYVGKIAFVPNGFEGSTVVEKEFRVDVKEDSNEDNPTPIYTVADFIKYCGYTSGDFILMNDLEIENHDTLNFNAKFNSFDGNNKVITIKSFAYSTNLVSNSADYSINLGLFNTVEQGTIIKNVIVAYPTRQSSASMNLKNYSTINFGGIAAINRGIITNCDVISISESKTSLSDYIKDAKYAINIETTDVINGNEVEANIGLFVGVNETTGIITNSRVGRDEVDILTIYDSQASVVYKTKYSKTSPIMLVKVYGKAEVGGFVATNQGTISSSFAKNLQIENISKSAKSFVKTAGFVVNNEGFIYGSYACGWEEDEIYDDVVVSSNRKLGGGILSNGSIAGFVYINSSYIEDCYSNINCSGDLTFVAKSNYVINLDKDDWASPSGAGFVYISKEGSYITTSYSLSKIEYSSASSGSVSLRPNTFGAFEGRMESPDAEFDNSGEIKDCYFMLEKTESFSYEHERAVKLTDDPSVELEDNEEAVAVNEFINKDCFNNFSFDDYFDAENSFGNYQNISTGGVWAINSKGTSGYPDLISANTIAISCRVINVTKTNSTIDGAGNINAYYYTYADGYEIGSYLNPYIVSNFDQFDNLFSDVLGSQSFNDEVTTKFVGNIRLINNIDFSKSANPGVVVHSTLVEYTSNADVTSIFDGNYLNIYNITLSIEATKRSSFGLFKDIYYASVKNLTLVVDDVFAGNTISVGALAGSIINGNISNVTLVATENGKGIVTGNNYVGALAGIIITGDSSKLYRISNIKSNLSVVGSLSDSTLNSITISGAIWERIKPITTAGGLSAMSSNLRLHKLTDNVYYAGGIAGLVDIGQKKEILDVFELFNANVRNIHVGELVRNSNLTNQYKDAKISYTNNIKIISVYAGGLFGFVGSQTYVERAELIVSGGDQNNYIRGDEIAGGIAGINFGKISQSYVSYSKEETNNLNDDITTFVNPGSSEQINEQIHANKTLFAVGNSKYIGGIAGINVGNGQNGSGTISNCYNRIDVKNENAIGVGGIVGGSYIGEIINVYTTASLMGKLFDYYDDSKTIKGIHDETKIGAIIGRIFENSNDGYFADYHLDKNSNNNLTLTNIVALNIWDSEDFDDFYEFDVMGGNIGALYGEFENKATESGNKFIKISTKIFVQNYLLKDYDNSYISSVDTENNEIFDVSNIDNYIELWGVSIDTNSKNYNDSIYTDLGISSYESLITPDELMALFSGTSYGVSTLRTVYFPERVWSRTIWNYDDDIALPILEYGYEPSIIRIYTANQFYEKLNLGNSSGKLYVIMNDIDFSGYVFGPEPDEPEEGLTYISINTIFRGQLYGNNVVYEEGDAKYTRYPVLFNISITGGNYETYAGIFANSIGATFKNFNIVLKEYDVTISSSEDNKIESETMASVLVANSVSTKIDNIHVYSSIDDNISEDIFRSTHKVKERILFDNFKVCTGYSVDQDNKQVEALKTYLKLATLNSKDARGTGTINTANKFYYTVDVNTDTFEFNKFVTKNGQGVQEEYGKDEFSTWLSEDGFSNSRKIDVGFDADTSLDERFYETLSVGACSEAKVCNARIVGLLTASGQLPEILYSSVNVPVSVSFSKNADTVYIGKVAGRIVGRIENVVSTKFLSINNTENNLEVSEAYIGGVVGYVEGAVTDCYVKGCELTLGNSSKVFNVKSGNKGFNVGGLFGAINKYSTLNNGSVGGTERLHVIDSKITTYINGTARIGGIIGKNDYSILTAFFETSADDGLEVYIFENNEQSVGGVVGTNTYSEITGVYSNANIKVNLEKNGINVSVGGIIGKSENTVKLKNVICDAKQIETTGKLCEHQYVGGLVGEVKNDYRVELISVLSCVDLLVCQAKNMYIGGMVGFSPSEIRLNDGICLGNITLKPIESFNGKTFNENDQYIGGLVGKCDNVKAIMDSLDKSENPRFLVLSTIRDYAIAQKANDKLNIGPVVGTKQGKPDFKDVYFNENISLVSDNGYSKNGFKNVEQNNEKLKEYFLSIFEKLYEYFNHKEFPYLFENFVKDEVNEYIKNPEGYKEDSKLEDIFIEGTKLNPIENTTSFVEDKYYIMTKDLLIIGSLSIPENAVINAQGYSFYTHTIDGVNKFKGNYTIFNTINEGGAIVGLIEDCDISALIESAVIAKTNNGFVFACGVSGKITGSSISSLVYWNCGVVSTSFSIADLSISSAGSGLALINGEEGKRGNIYNCFYTGTLTPTDLIPSISGLCNNNVYGAISNCYTMADIDIKGNETITTTNIYPATRVTTGSANLYKCFYDYVAYTGPNEGYSIGDENVKNNGYITDRGIYVWSSSLAGASSNSSADDIVSSIIDGNWSEPGNVEQIKEMFKKTDECLTHSYSENDIIIDTSWFNFGYITINYINIFVNGNNAVGGGADTDDNIMRYLQLIYTGNGLANKYGQTRENNSYDLTTKPNEEDRPRTCGFVDGPYQVKHPGMIDILVRANNIWVNNDPQKRSEVSIEYRYYLMRNVIDFQKYSKSTYWSEIWDEKGFAFLGDLDGNSKKIINMFSSAGFLRVVSEGTINQPYSVVYDLNFEKCFSKTGIVAGGLAKGKLENITLKDCIVYNGNTGNLGKSDATLFGKTIELNNSNFIEDTYDTISYKIDTSLIGSGIFAGSLIGIMTDGIISSSCKSGGQVYVSAIANPDKTSYIGGLVGEITGGIIGEDLTGNWNINNLYLYANENGGKSYVGGIAGRLADVGKILGKSGKVVNVGVTVVGPNVIGGAVGLLQGGSVQYVNCSGFSLTIDNYQPGKTDDKNFTFNTKSTTISESTYAGGIVGEMQSGNVTNCNVASAISLECATLSSDFTITNTNFVFVGGIVGKQVSGNVKNCLVNANVKSTSNYSVVGGIVADLVGGTVENNQVDDATIGQEIVPNVYISGGIVGLMRSGLTKGNTNEGAVTAQTNGMIGLSIAGGVVGFIYYNGTNDCKIETCTNNGKIQGMYSGGVVGYIYDAAEDKEINIKTCTNNAEVGNESSIISGGIVGFANNENNARTKIEGFKNTGKITANNSPSNTFAGGIIGVGKQVTLTASVEDADNTGAISGGFVNGGIAGYLINSVLTKSNNRWIDNKGSVSGGYISGGVIGLAGDGSSTIEINAILSSADGTIKNGGNGIAGGIIGIANGIKIGAGIKLTNSSAVGDSNSFVAGGVVGWILKIDDSNNVVSNWTNNANVTASASSTVLPTNTNNKYQIDKFNSSNVFKFVRTATGANSSLIGELSGGVTAGGVIGYTKSVLNGYNLDANSGTVTSATNAGGILGLAGNTTLITNSTNKMTVTGKVAGGIISIADGNVSIKTGENNAENKKPGVTYGQVNNEKAVTGIDLAGGIAGQMTGGTIAGINGDGNQVENAGDVTSSAGTAGGLVGKLSGGTISYSKNSKTVTGGANAGGFVGQLSGGTINGTNTTTGTVQGSGSEKKGNSGGLVGLWDTTATLNSPSGGYSGITVKNAINAGGAVGKINNSQVSLSVTISGNISGDNAGGLVGEMSNGTISGGQGGTASGTTNAGGLVGKMTDGTITYGKGGTAKDATNAGGLVGYLEKGTISGGEGVSASGTTNVGGLVGQMIGGEISSGKGGSVSTGTYAGGLVGSMSNGKISGGKAPSSVKASTYAGGIVGQMTGGSIGTAISASGTTIQGGTHAGGLVGYLNGGQITGGIGGEVNNATYAGGVVGEITGTSSIGGNIATGKVIGTSTNPVHYAGGVAGKASGGAIGVNPTGSVSAWWNIGDRISYAGGVVGEVAGSIALGGGAVGVTINGGDKRGGLIGHTSSGQVNIAGNLAISVSSSTTNGGNITWYGIVDTNSVKIGGASQVTITCERPLVYSNSGNLANLKVDNDDDEYISGDTVGGIACTNSGTIYKCENNNNIEGSTAAGGIVGKVTGGTVSNCVNNGYIRAKGASNSTSAIPEVTKSNDWFEKTDKKTTPTAYVGGIAGQVTGGNVSGKNNKDNNISNSANYSDSNGITDYRGQIAGASTGSVKNEDGHSGIKTKKTVEEDKDKYVMVALRVTLKEYKSKVFNIITDEGEKEVTKKYPIYEFKAWYGIITKDEKNTIIDDRGTGNENYNGANYEDYKNASKVAEDNKEKTVTLNNIVPCTNSLGDWKNFYPFDREITESEEDQYIYWHNGDVGKNGVSEDDVVQGTDYENMSQFWYFVTEKNKGIRYLRLKNKAREVWDLDDILGSKSDDNDSDVVFSSRWVHDTNVWNNAKNSMYNVAIYKKKNTTYETYDNSELQDCGGHVDTVTQDGGKDITKKSQKRALTLKALYDLCGPCDGGNFASSVSVKSVANGSGVTAPEANNVWSNSETDGSSILAQAWAEYNSSTNHHSGGQKYWSWWGYSDRVEWCAIFVSYCANQLGYIDAGIMPLAQNCKVAWDWYNGKGLTKGASVTPEPGWIIFFKNTDGKISHTGIVSKVENGVVYSIDGNWTDQIKEHSCASGAMGSGDKEIFIYGYATPNYPAPTYTYSSSLSAQANVIAALAAEGYNKASICGILGNMAQECGGANVMGTLNWQQHTVSDSGDDHYGLCQWSKKYFNPSSSYGFDAYRYVDGNKDTDLKHQIECLLIWIDGRYSKNYPDSEAGAAQAADDFERVENSGRSQVENRKNQAKVAYRNYSALKTKTR